MSSHPRLAGAARARSYEERIEAPPDREPDDGNRAEAPAVAAPLTPEEPMAPEERAEDGAGTAGEEPELVPPRPLARPELLTGRRRRPRAAKWGFRGALSRAGIRMDPGAMESRHLEHEEFIRQTTWSRPVNLAVIDDKGGSGKTPTAVTVGGCVASLKGGLTLIWEATEAEGTLEARTEGRSTRGLNGLLETAESVRTPGVMSAYVKDQTSYAQVLGSTGKRVLTGKDVTRLFEVFEHTHRIIVTDTGNDPDSEVFTNVMARADAIVVPVPMRADHANKVVSLLHRWRSDPEMADLVKRATVVITDDGKKQTPGLAQNLSRTLEDLGVESIKHVPYDPALDNDGPIVLEDLSRESRVAWTNVTAAIVASINVK